MRAKTRRAGNTNGFARYLAGGLLFAACLSCPLPLFSAIEIVTESRPMRGGTNTVSYWQAFGGYRSDEKGPLEKTEVRYTPESIVTRVRAGRPGAAALWETTLPGRCIQKLTGEATPHVWLLLDDTAGGSKAGLVFSLDAGTGAAQWRREYGIPVGLLKLFHPSGDYIFLGAGPYVEALDPATGVTLKRFFLADPAQSVRIEGGDLRVQTTEGDNVRLPLPAASLPIPPSPDPAMAGVLLAQALHCMPGIPAGTLSGLWGKCPKAVRIALDTPSCIPIYEKEARLDPGNPFLHFFLGLARKGRDLETEMKAAFDRAESVPDLPFFEYAALGNLFELSYLPDHADLCYAMTLKAFRSQLPLSPIEYCPEELHRAFFPADLEAGGMHISQGNIVRYLKLRNIRRQMFLHSDGDFLDALRALNLRDDPRLKSVMENESAYFAALKRDPFLRENHLPGLDAGFLLVKVLAWSAVLFLVLAFLGFLFIPFVVLFLILARWIPTNAFVMNFLRGYPAILVAAIHLLFLPLAVFEFAIGSIARVRASFRMNLKTVLFWIWLLSFIFLWYIFDYFRSPEWHAKLVVDYILAGIVLMMLLALRKLFAGTDLLSEIRALIREATVKKEWLVPGMCFGILCLLASLVVSFFPLSDFTFHPAPGMTFLYAHPRVARQIDARSARVHGARQRDTLLFLKAVGLHMKGDLDAADALYRRLPKSPWVLNNQAAVLFQRGLRGQALKAWQDLAGRNFHCARANLEQARNAGAAESGPPWVPLLANPPADVLHSALVSRSWWRIWDPDFSDRKALQGSL